MFIWVSFWAIGKFWSENLNIYYLSLTIILFVVVIQIPKQNIDLEADFKHSWKKYLKE
ncbi:MAG: hypothetical protein ACPLKV_01105 [Minisyncoccia bacterium]